MSEWLQKLIAVALVLCVVPIACLYVYGLHEFIVWLFNASSSQWDAAVTAASVSIAVAAVAVAS